MRHAMHWLICVSLMTALLGCDGGTKPPVEKNKPATGPAETSAPAPADDKQSSNQPAADSGKFVLVSLNVPNMT
jgi:hypothetical protein